MTSRGPDKWDPGVDHFAHVEAYGKRIERWTCSCGRVGRTSRSLKAHFERVGIPPNYDLIGDPGEVVI